MLDLESEWRYYQLSSSTEQNQKSWADSMKMIGCVRTVPELLFTLDETEKRGMENLTDLNLFKNNIQPMWEDPANVNGGRCIMEVPTSQRDAVFDLWRSTVAFCCSNAFETVSGCVYNEKANFRISIWVSDPRENEELMKAWRETLRNSQSMFSFALHNKYSDHSKNRKRFFNKNKA